MIRLRIGPCIPKAKSNKQSMPFPRVTAEFLSRGLLVNDFCVINTYASSVDTFQLSILGFSRIVNEFHDLTMAAFQSLVIDRQSNQLTLYIGHYMQIERSPGLATERTLKCRFQDASRLDFSILLYNNYRTTEQIIR